MGLPCVSSSTPTGGGAGTGGAASSPPPSGGVSPTPVPPATSCQLSVNYASCIQTCDQNFGPDDEQNLPLWKDCRNSCNANACSGTCPSNGTCQANTEVVTSRNPVTNFTYSIEKVKSCGCGPAPIPPALPNASGCKLNSSYSSCLQPCQQLESAGKRDEAFSCYKSCANSYSFEPAGTAANSVCSGDVCKDSSGKPLSGYCRPTAYSNKQNSAGEQVLLATACGCQSPTFGALYYCNAPGDYRSQNNYPGTALDNLNSSDKWAGGGVFCRDQCARFGPNYACSARNSGCFCECNPNKVKCPANLSLDPVTCACVNKTSQTGNFSGNGTSGGCGNGTPCCGSTSDLTCGGSCPPGQYCSTVGYNSSGQNLSLGQNLCQCVGPQLVDMPCNLTSDCNGYCGDAGSWCALSKNGACVCTRTPDKVHVDVSIIKTPVRVGDTGPIRAHVYWDDNTPATGSVTFVLGASSRTETLDSGGLAQVWGLCLSLGTTPARALYHGVEGSAPFVCVD